jgi:hypothetical protein
MHPTTAPRRFSGTSKWVALSVAFGLGFGSTGCFRHGGRIFEAMAWTAIVTSAIVSSHPPPREVVIEVPGPRSGYSWQPGYWDRSDGEWVWVEGAWVRNYPGYRWRPTRWIEDPDGNWRLVPGEWLAIDGPRPPPP